MDRSYRRRRFGTRGHLAQTIVLSILLESSSPLLVRAEQAGDMSGAAADAAKAAADAAQAAAQMMSQAMSNMAQGQSNISQGQSSQNQGQVQQGMMQMAMSAMQMLMSLLGALASQAAKGQSNKGNQNAGNMGGGNGAYQSSLTEPGATSPTGSSGNTGGPGSGSLGDPSTSTLDLTPPGLRQGQVGAAFDALEKNFGLNRDEVMNALKNGVDPKDILAGAPKNAPSAELVAQLADRLAPAGAGGGAGTRIPASPPPAAPSPAPSATDLPPEALASAGPRKGPSGDIPFGEMDPETLRLSPEVRAALDARAAPARAALMQEPADGWNIFQLVHRRYEKVTPMLYGRVEATRVDPVPAELRGY